MNGLLIRKLFLFTILISVTIPAFSDCKFYRYASGIPDGELFSKSYEMQKKAKVKKPVSAKKAQRKQEAKEKQRDKDYADYVKENKKHALEIQTPVVRERMKQNVKDANANYKAKKKSSAAQTKKGAKKYGR